MRPCSYLMLKTYPQKYFNRIVSLPKDKDLTDQLCVSDISNIFIVPQHSRLPSLNLLLLLLKEVIGYWLKLTGRLL